MVDKICDYLINKIRKQMPEIDDERAEVMNYGMHLVVGEIPKTFIFILIAAVLGILKEFFITMLVIFPYRTFSGGVHLKTHIGCIVATSLMYCGTAYLSKFQIFFRRYEICSNIFCMDIWNNYVQNVCSSRYRKCSDFKKKR